MTEKLPHSPERYVGRWAVGLNSRLGKIASVRRDPQGAVIYEGTTLDGDPWWTRVAQLLDDRDNAALNRRDIT